MKRVTRHKSSALNLPTLRLEGGLFLPDVLEKAALGNARLQADADYGIPKGLKQKDEYSRAFQIASAQWKHFEKQMERTDLDAVHATATFVIELLHDTLGYPAVGACTGVKVGDRHYNVTHIASNGSGLQLPIVIAPHTLGLDEADTIFGVRHVDGSASGTRKKSPFQLMQELLNASPDHQWGLVTNGKTIRILRDAATLTRPSYLDIDMADLLSGQRYAEFAYAWRLLHASRAGLQATSDYTVKQPVVWETWREAGQEEGTRVRNGLRLGVTQALLTFGNGFLQHPANDSLRMALQNGELKKKITLPSCCALFTVSYSSSASKSEDCLKTPTAKPTQPIPKAMHWLACATWPCAAEPATVLTICGKACALFSKVLTWASPV